MVVAVLTVALVYDAGTITTQLTPSIAHRTLGRHTCDLAITKTRIATIHERYWHLRQSRTAEEAAPPTPTCGLSEIVPGMNSFVTFRNIEKKWRQERRQTDLSIPGDWENR